MRRLLVPGVLLLTCALAGCGAAGRPDPAASAAQDRLIESVNAAIEELPGYQGAMAGTGADGASDKPVAMGALGVDSAVGAVSVQAICEDTSGAERTATVRINDGEPVELPCLPNGGLQSVASGIAPEGDEVRVVFEGLPGTAAWGFGVVANDE